MLRSLPMVGQGAATNARTSGLPSRDRADRRREGAGNAIAESDQMNATTDLHGFMTGFRKEGSAIARITFAQH
ncbi:hypothetical protein [Panacagrimonas sp.]|uniref:hypothetical protein n=1 Tax=Panacagrimonas sp. TaxID=2480088 RepID=UPI003B522722